MAKLQRAFLRLANARLVQARLYCESISTGVLVNICPTLMLSIVQMFYALVVQWQ